MKVLVVTSEWPRFPGDLAGIHVIHQIRYLEQLGVQVDIFSFQGRKHPINYWRARRNFLRKDLSTYNLIHAHHGQSGVVALAQKKLPLIVTFHGSDLQGIRDHAGRITLQGYILRYISRWVARRAQSVILVSKTLVRLLPTGLDYHIIPAGIDTNLFSPMPMTDARQALGLPLDARLVLFVGEPARTEKRHWLAQEVMRHLPTDLTAKLVTISNVPHDKMPLYMNACDALLVTSSTEGSPNAVKEALACNLPIVSTDVGDIRARIGGLSGCRVCTKAQPEILAQALTDVLAYPERIAGRESAMELDESYLAARVLALYKQVTGFSA